MLTHVRFLVLVLLLNVCGGLQSLDYTTLRLSTAELSQLPVLGTNGLRAMRARPIRLKEGVALVARYKATEDTRP
jgi:hypothetical protein